MCMQWINKDICDDRSMWNPSTCAYECYKSCHVGAYLSFMNYKCRKILVDDLVLACEDAILSATESSFDNNSH